MNRATLKGMDWKRNLRFGRVGLVLACIIGMSVSCDGRRFFDVESAPVVLLTPVNGVYRDYVGIKFGLTEEARDGALQGWVTGDGCQVTVSVCDDGACAMAFRAIVPPDKEVFFEENSWDNAVLDHYIGKFDGSSTPLCSCAGPREEKHTIGIRLDSDLCPARLEAVVGMDLVEEDEY